MKTNNGLTRVLLVGGSNAHPSRCSAVLDTTADLVESAGAEAVRWHVGLSGTPGPSAYGELRERANAAQALVFVTPLYHGSYSGVLKTTLDHLERGHLAGKPVALLSTSNSPSAQAIDHLRVVVGALRGVVIPSYVMATDADFARHDGGYSLTGGRILERIVDLIEELLWFSTQLSPSARGRDEPAAVGDGARLGLRRAEARKGAPHAWTGQLSEPITRAVAYIRDNYSDSELTLDTVASHARISRYHFSRTFKAQTGRRFIDYLTMLRLNRARTMLAQTDRSITAICHTVGFRDLSHFERTFKTWFGMPPSEFRRNQSERLAGAAPRSRYPGGSVSLPSRLTPVSGPA
ncbi:MAG TPA: helix-turn-helix domain-containing protein [Actinoplanes sp.]|nr:helix-turn-helix domain-containing protein [Actinoplanes sp.]